MCKAISLILRTRDVSLQNHTSCVFPRLTKHSLVLVILACFSSAVVDVEGCIHVKPHQLIKGSNQLALFKQ